jgi:copper(I)-binding protein
MGKSLQSSKIPFSYKEIFMVRQLLVRILFVFASCSALTTFAQTQAGNLQISQPTVRTTSPGQMMSSAYLVIENKGATPDRLVAVSYSFAKEVQIHEMKMDGDKMMMRQMTALEIPGNSSVELKSGGYHLMMMGLKEPIKEGEAVKMTLQFEKAGKVEISFQTKSMAGMKH